ncbi:MAG: radical SAM protein [Vicinamibacterales bacterium]
MQPSIFNVQVPLPERNEVFLMNTFSDAQLLVSPDVPALLERIARDEAAFTAEERETVTTLADNGFIVQSHETERRRLAEYFGDIREDAQQMKVTVLTTLQCNFACDYCFQGDHGDHNLFAQKMTLEQAAKVVAWIDARLDALHPERFILTLFGGEPLLNLPVAYYLAERCHEACRTRGIEQKVSIITNGLLLTEEVVDRLLPHGLMGVKITLDGDRDTHNRMRPLRGRQGTFDRIIENMRRVGHKVPLTVGGNFDESSVHSYPALLDFLREQAFADNIVKVNFKPIITQTPMTPPGVIPLTAVSASGRPLNGTCMTSAGAGTSVGGPCDSCHFVDEQMTFLRNETRRRGFPTPDGVHMGPCEIHRKHAYTIGPDGSLYACPGFTGDSTQSTGHIDGRQDARRVSAATRFDALAPYDNCGDCHFIPVCAGGCSVASHTELGDMNMPSCHKGSFEAALVSLAQSAAAVY